MAKMERMNKEKLFKTNLQFLKLGGSLITDKDLQRSPRIDVINGLAHEIYSVKKEMPDLKLIVGHGSGSFGHVPAIRFNTRQGVNSPHEWRGFAEVWWDAATLNHLVIEALHQAAVPAISFPISSSAITQDGKVISWSLEPIKSALNVGMMPVVFGDVVFDLNRGGTILSTEDIFRHLALNMGPKKILLAGIEEGVWLDYPQCTRLVSELAPSDSDKVISSLSGAAATDVTGGMATKVEGMLDLVTRVPGIEVQIFSGNPPSNLTKVLQGSPLGTKIKSQ